jgi:uncharacterized membrane protein
LIRQHERPRLQNVNEIEQERRTMGERASDRIASTVGSWRFILVQSGILMCWIIVNAIAWAFRWDPYPFILLNLTLSFQAAFTAPIIMMSQNRQATRDRLRAELDFEVNRRAESEVAIIQTRLDDLAGRQWEALVRLQRDQLDVLNRIEDMAVRLDQRLSTGGDGKTP